MSQCRNLASITQKSFIIGKKKKCFAIQIFFVQKVCSRLAFECLSSIKSGNSTPHFVENDPHLGLLIKTIQVSVMDFI